jgi:hypothetical protein
MRKRTARWGLSTAVLVVAGLALTACGPNDATSAGGSTSSSAPASSAQPSTQPSAQATQPPAASGQGSTAPTSAGSGVANAGDQVTIVGKLQYLAPGKLIVHPDDGSTDQAFYVSNDTQILGAAAICSATDGNVTIGDDGYGTSKCTEAQLETAAKTNSVTVRVTMVRNAGSAETVEEKYHP